MTVQERESLTMATKAFELFTLEEKEAALRVFAELKYRSVSERFFECVHRVILVKS